MGGQRKGPDMTLMGSFELRWDGLPVLDYRWTRGKAKALLKVLALTDGRVLHREQLMDLLWPSLGPSAAANQLRKNLHYLRAELDRHGLSSPVTASHDLVLLAGDVQVDVDRMRGLADIAGLGEDPEAYERALHAWSGDLLPEDAFEDWTHGSLGLPVQIRSAPAATKEKGGARSVGSRHIDDRVS